MMRFFLPLFPLGPGCAWPDANARRQDAGPPEILRKEEQWLAFDGFFRVPIDFLGISMLGAKSFT